jgi:hypothetical protein
LPPIRETSLATRRSYRRQYPSTREVITERRYFRKSAAYGIVMCGVVPRQQDWRRACRVADAGSTRECAATPGLVRAWLRRLVSHCVR